jgi:hypothetical protein
LANRLGDSVPQREMLPGEEGAMSLGIYLYITTMVVAGNFLLCTMCSPFCTRKQRLALRGAFALGLVAVTGIGYSLYGGGFTH